MSPTPMYMVRSFLDVEDVLSSPPDEVASHADGFWASVSPVAAAAWRTGRAKRGVAMNRSGPGAAYGMITEIRRMAGAI